MKQIIVAALLSLAITGCQAADTGPASAKSLAPEEVSAQIASLRELIIPCKGTARADVDAVFGEPEVTKELKGKGSAAMYPMHSYQLLPPKQGQEFRAFLYVTYRNDKAHFVGINHICTVKGRAYPADPKELESEDRLVLADLLEIKKKYDSKLRDASWNNPIEPIPTQVRILREPISKEVTISDSKQIATLLAFFPGYDSQAQEKLATGSWPMDRSLVLRFADGRTVKILVAGDRWSSGGKYAQIQGDFSKFLKGVESGNEK